MMTADHQWLRRINRPDWRLYHVTKCNRVRPQVSCASLHSLVTLCVCVGSYWGGGDKLTVPVQGSNNRQTVPAVAFVPDYTHQCVIQTPRGGAAFHDGDKGPYSNTIVSRHNLVAGTNQ